MAPVAGADDETEYWISVQRDVTAVRRMWERLLDVQEEERRRIDQEIHDEMGGLLTSIQMKAQTARFEAKNNGISLDSLDEMSELLNDLSVAARTIARQLHPRVLDTYGLSEAVSNLVNTIEEQHDLTIDVQNDVGSADDYSALVERTAYRVIQEALLNVVRHAQVDTATVRLRETDRHLLLHVIDDGVGFDPAEREEEDNYGLKGITDRVERLDGTVDINTTPHEGTQITTTIPLTTSSLPTTLRTGRLSGAPNGE
jgi:signal transduction histidine kinase